MRNEISVGIENQEKEDGKKSLKYFDRDCEAKQEILTVLLNHPNGLNLNQLYNLCDYKGKLSTFKSNLSKYANGAVTENGRRIIKPELQYVNRIGKRGSYIYILNDNGVKKAINDPLYFRRKQKEKREEWENQFIQHHFLNTEGGSSGHSVQYVEKLVGRDFGDANDRPVVDKSDETTDKLNVVELKDNEIAELKSKNKKTVNDAKEALYQRDKKIVELEQQLAQKNNIPAGMSPKEYKSKMKTEQRIAYRKDLVVYYEENHNDFVDYVFFNNWEMYPVRVKGKNVIKKGDIEIMSKTNSEFARGHVKGMLSADDVIKGRFHITKKTKSGIHVIGKGMTEAKLMKW